ncbi:MAG: hypothetical protein MZW92_78135 [Comamonadaceae bacterium]|nr:hypothetical protein [Comamonadaceae bacterium]
MPEARAAQADHACKPGDVFSREKLTETHQGASATGSATRATPSPTSTPCPTSTSEKRQVAFTVLRRSGPARLRAPHQHHRQHRAPATR